MAAPGSVSLVGLGHMGFPIAERVLRAGYELTVFNRTPGKAGALVEDGAAEGGSFRELFTASPICISSLADDTALEAVLLGPNGGLAHAPQGTLLIETSTVSAHSSQAIARAAEIAGVEYLRAPVSGNPSVVRAGNLTIVVSGPAGAKARADDLLRAIGPNIYDVGDAEQARVVKLALQVMISGTAQLMSEALVLGELGGVERSTLLEVLGNSAAGSPFVRYKTAALVDDDYSATFTTEMLAKDVGLVLAMGKQLGASLPVTEAVSALTATAIKNGYGDLDFMALLLSLRRSSGLGTPP